MCARVYFACFVSVVEDMLATPEMKDDFESYVGGYEEDLKRILEGMQQCQHRGEKKKRRFEAP